MAYSLDYSLALGSGRTGLADLRAQLVDTTGANVGAAISTGFVEIGSGNYLWHYASFPDGHRGGVKFYSNATPATILAFAAVNPEEGEYTDAKTSTRLPTSTYSAPPSVTAIRSEMDTNSTKLANLDATVSSRLATAGYTAPDNASVTAIKAKTDNLPATPAATGDAMTLTAGERTSLAAAIWNALTSGFATVGSVGKKLADWVLGSDNKVVLSNNAHTGAVIPTVTDITNDVTTTFVLKKNTALSNFEFAMFSGSTPKTGLAITSTRSIDGGAFAATTNSASEVGNGVYKINLSTTDLNGDVITFRFVGSGADDTLITVLTQS